MVRLLDLVSELLRMNALRKKRIDAFHGTVRMLYTRNVRMGGGELVLKDSVFTDDWRQEGSIEKKICYTVSLFEFKND